MAWNISFHIDESHDGIYYGSAWFTIRVNDKIERKWVHKFDILGEPLIILTADKEVKHLDLTNALWNAYERATLTEDSYIRWVLRLRDYDEIYLTSKAHILLKWVFMDHHYKRDAIERISRYTQCPQERLVNVMPLPFSLLFEQWG